LGAFTARDAPGIGEGSAFMAGGKLNLTQRRGAVGSHLEGSPPDLQIDERTTLMGAFTNRGNPPPSDAVS